MPPENYYQQELARLQQQLSVLLSKKTNLGWARFATVVVLAAAVYFLWHQPVIQPILAGLLLVVIFARLIFADSNNQQQIKRTNQLVAVNGEELKALKHQYYHFANGSEYLQPEHPYANDLDIFGRASLFQYVNRTTSDMGGSVLASWLLQPDASSNIIQKQEAVKELAGQNEWQQSLQAIGREKKIQSSTQERLAAWMAAPDEFINTSYWQWLRYLLPLVICSALVLYLTDEMPIRIFSWFLLAFAIIAYVVNKKVAPVHAQLSKMVDEMDVLLSSIQLLEAMQFSSPLLLQLQKKYVSGPHSAPVELKKIKTILERLDLLYNLVLSAPLNLFLLWGLQQVMSLEKWKLRNKEQVTSWFTVLGQFEALNSLAILRFNHPAWVFPTLNETHFSIEGSNIGHPLISPEKRVDNDITIQHAGELMLVTGSNMAGKSTYLRSIGINVVLAMAGAPVCAKSLSVSPVSLISSMRIADNLEESTSTFYAELKKLKAIIESVNGGKKVFILLDEILRGTNSLDRHTGSVALVKQLIKHHAVGIIATHDVELAELKSTYPENILNYHFDAAIQDGELYFDYLLKPGICTSLNASILMKKIGIELDGD